MTNSLTSAVSTSTDQSARMEEYYRFQAKIYDATRWSFLFGRKEIIQKISALASPTHILEIGCGTGQNLIRLGRTFPQAQITGLDASESMLAVARRNLGPLTDRVVLIHQVYDHPLQQTVSEGKFNLILCSYSLSMMNPGWGQVIDSAYRDLGEGGLMAVVDFHDSNWPLFKWLMRIHVRLNGHLLPKLQVRFNPLFLERRLAYGGFWQYLIFIGVKRKP